MAKCSKCGGKVCQRKAMYYNELLNKLCNECRQKELDKLMEKK